MSKSPLSIYVHIPFCVKKCSYCDFMSFASTPEEMERYRDALLREISEAEDSAQYEVQTVYIGGGTPSWVSPCLLAEILDALRIKYEFAPDAEISMEMNPGTLKDGALEIYRSAGINRISIGCQSLDDEELKVLGRIHTSEEFMTTFKAVRDAGFDNINVDLMSSIPGQTAEKFRRSLEGVLELSPEHISVYSLIIEPGTPFYALYEKGELDLPSEDTVLETDRMVRRVLAEKGYKRYEISNYAREGYECRHNLVYWQHGDYRGFGPGAASLMGRHRFTNTRVYAEYMKAPGGEKEEDFTLTLREAMEEFMFLGLRTCAGVSEEKFRLKFGKEITEEFGDVIKDQVNKGLLVHENSHFYYTEAGMDVSNVLMSEFLE